jgi:hypothetical protein
MIVLYTISGVLVLLSVLVIVLTTDWSNSKNREPAANKKIISLTPTSPSTLTFPYNLNPPSVESMASFIYAPSLMRIKQPQPFVVSLTESLTSNGFIISSIQALFHIPEFTDWLENQQIPSHPIKEMCDYRDRHITHELKRLLGHYKNPKKMNLNISAFIDSMIKCEEIFNLDIYSDPSPSGFLDILLDFLDEEDIFMGGGYEGVLQLFERKDERNIDRIIISSRLYDLGELVDMDINRSVEEYYSSHYNLKSPSVIARMEFDLQVLEEREGEEIGKVITYDKYIHIIPEVKYELVSVIVYSHYKYSTYAVVDGIWYHFAMSEVRKIDLGYVNHKITKGNTYLLFYRLLARA